MCINLDNFTTIIKNAYLWIYNSRNNYAEAYSNVIIAESCKLPDYTVAVFDNRHRHVSNKEFDVWMRAGYYLIWELIKMRFDMSINNHVALFYLNLH